MKLYKSRAIPQCTFLFATIALPASIHAACECGYKVASTLYTELLETEFLHLPNITTDTDWQPQNYTVSSALSRGPYGKNASLANILANPLESKYDWAGQGVNGSDAGLQMFVMGIGGKDSEGVVESGGLVGMAEMVSTRNDVLYGSFRAAVKITREPGTCSAFFWVSEPLFSPFDPLHAASTIAARKKNKFLHLASCASQYYNDTQEIDIELLSSQQNTTSHPANLVLQSPQSAQQGFNAASTNTFNLNPLPFDPSDGFHEYRFDWSPSAVTFLADGQLLSTMTTAIPTSPGHITLSHWSTGNADWSGGPPERDAVMVISYVKAYFNSSDPKRVSEWGHRCRDPGGVNASCEVPEVVGAPQGNESGKTRFFSGERGMAVGQAVVGNRKNSMVSQRVLPSEMRGRQVVMALAMGLELLGLVDL